MLFAREARNGDVPHAFTRLQPLHGAIRSDGRHHREDHRRNEVVRRSERENRVIDHDQEAPWK